MSVKEQLQSIDALRRVVKAHKVRREMRTDANRFVANYAESMSDHACVDYHVLLIVHSLEKGMCSQSLRPFGKKKVRELIDYLRRIPRTRRYRRRMRWASAFFWFGKTCLISMAGSRKTAIKP